MTQSLDMASQLSNGFSELVDRIQAIAAELDDIAFDQLREAVADGNAIRPTSDRKLMQARRALDKAAAVLGQLDLQETDLQGK